MIAGYVAPDLGDWHYWGAVPDYVALMKSSVRQQFPSKLAMVEYLHHSPDARSLGIELPPHAPHASSPGRVLPVMPQ